MIHLSPRNTSLLVAAAGFCFTALGQSQMRAKSVSMSAPGTHTAANDSDAVPNRLISAQVHDGILTIDGLVANVEMNYQIQRSGYMYFFVPGVGTAVVSLSPIPGAERVNDAIEGNVLHFDAGGHTFELTNNGNLLGKDKTTDVYVRLDRSTVAVGRRPRMGFGDSATAPYAWPLSGPAEVDTTEYVVTPPPMPKSVLPRTVATASMSPTRR